MTKIEQAARAAYEVGETKGWDNESDEEFKQYWRDVARAVLDSLGEPSEGMLKAGRSEQGYCDITGARNVWRDDPRGEGGDMTKPSEAAMTAAKKIIDECGHIGKSYIFAAAVIDAEYAPVVKELVEALNEAMERDPRATYGAALQRAKEIGG